MSGPRDGNPFSVVIQVFHSVLIDELNHRFPDVKLELGLPKKGADWFVPDGLDANCVAARAKVAGESPAGSFSCTVLLVSDSLAVSDLWSAVQKRAEVEFGRRATSALIEPFEPVLRLSERQEKVTRALLWIPLRVDGVPCYLGYVF